MSAYQTLQISANSDERAIKRAYAGLIKQFRPETHPADFARIREAYEAALQDFKWRQQWQFEDDAENAAFEGDNAEQAIVETALADTAQFTPVEQPAAETNIQPVMEMPPFEAQPQANLTETAPFTITLSEEQLNAYFTDAAIEPPIADANLDDEATLASEEKLESITQRYFIKLNTYAETSDEKAAEILTEALIGELGNTTLDEKISLEDSLLSWYLNAEAPLLLAFIWLNNTFGWTSNSVSMAQHYGDWQANRISRIHELAMMYAQALNSGDVGLVHLSNQPQPLNTTESASRKWLITTAEAQVSSPLRQRWLDLCEFNGYEKLAGYFKIANISRWQLVWADVIFGAFFAVLAWLFCVTFSPLKFSLLCFFALFYSVTAA